MTRTDRCIAAIFTCFGCASACAQQPFEAAAFAGYRMGGSFDQVSTAQQVDLDSHGAFAIALDLRRDSTSQYELFFARQSTRLSGGTSLGHVALEVNYLQVGGTLVTNNRWRAKPYIAGALGLAQFRPGPYGTHNVTRPSASLSVGLRVPVTARFALRLEARGYVTMVNSDTTFFCSSDSQGGLCRIHSRGTTFAQYELMAGAAFAF